MTKPGLRIYFLPYLILIGFLIGAYSDLSRKISDEKHDMIQQLALTESNINEVTNHNISKMIGVTAHISINTDIDIEELNYFVQKVVHSEKNIISNLGIFEDTTAIYIYPYEANKDMSNINLANIPSQKNDALRVKNGLEIVITAPVEVVQGGIGIMTRMPITLPDGSYWGQLGYMMKIDDIIGNLFLDTDNYTYLITQYDTDSGLSHLVYDSGFKEKLLVDEISIKLPSGYWKVQIGYNNLLGLTSLVFYIMIFSAIIFFVLARYIISKFEAYNTELLYLSQRDELTGLKNRRSVKNSLDTFNSVLMLDIDDFKKINDKYGHYVGDEILLQLSRRVESITRKNDVVVRWGGEEFLILMVSTDNDSALIAANRVLDKFKKPFTVDKNVLRVTASIGVACSNDVPNIQMEKVIKAADDAMYISKKNGKNQITMNKNIF